MQSPWDKETPEVGIIPGNEATRLTPALPPPLQVSTDPQRGEDRFRVVTTRLALALQAGNIGVWEWDFTSNHLVWDARMYAMYGIPDGTPITSELWRKAVHPDDLNQAGGIFTPSMERGLRQKHRFRIQHPGKGIRYLEAAEELVLNAQGAPIACVGIAQDVTEWWEMREALLARQGELERDSLTDPLTGVGNRRSLDQSLAKEVSRVRRYGGKLSFLIADIDNFKSINDRFGHEAGDRALRAIAETILSMVRDTDCVARFGGDEFCVVMPATGGFAAGALAERIRGRLGRTRIGAARQRLTASFGIVQFRDGETVGSLLHRADQALYQAKAFGKNRTMCFGDAGRTGRRRSEENAGRAAAQKTIRCIHCFCKLGYAASAGRRAALQAKHQCAEGLLARQAAASLPYN